MRRQRVPVGDEMERLVFGRAIGQACVLHLQPIRQRAEVMADVEASCGPHPAQYPFLFCFLRFWFHLRLNPRGSRFQTRLTAVFFPNHPVRAFHSRAFTSGVKTPEVANVFGTANAGPYKGPFMRQLSRSSPLRSLAPSLQLSDGASERSGDERL